MLLLMARPRPGFKPSNGFKPGNCANPRGRGAGSRGKYPKSIWQKIEQLDGNKDPLLVMAEYVSSTVVDPALRLQAAGMLAQYKYGKRPSYHYIEDIVGLEPPKTAADATAYQAKVLALMAAGKLDLASGQGLMTALQGFIDAKSNTELEETVEQLGVLVREILARGLTAGVTAEGGLPVAPGFEGIRMPQLGPPPIEGKAHPWAAPDVAALVEAVPRRRRKPPSDQKPGAGPKQPPEPKDAPEGS
jgi:hypothetical protein